MWGLRSWVRLCHLPWPQLSPCASVDSVTGFGAASTLCCVSSGHVHAPHRHVVFYTMDTFLFLSLSCPGANNTCLFFCLFEFWSLLFCFVFQGGSSFLCSYCWFNAKLSTRHLKLLSVLPDVFAISPVSSPAWALSCSLSPAPRWTGCLYQGYSGPCLAFSWYFLLLVLDSLFRDLCLPLRLLPCFGGKHPPKAPPKVCVGAELFEAPNICNSVLCPD